MQRFSCRAQLRPPRRPRLDRHVGRTNAFGRCVEGSGTPSPRLRLLARRRMPGRRSSSIGRFDRPSRSPRDPPAARGRAIHAIRGHDAGRRRVRLLYRRDPLAWWDEETAPFYPPREAGSASMISSRSDTCPDRMSRGQRPTGELHAMLQGATAARRLSRDRRGAPASCPSSDDGRPCSPSLLQALMGAGEIVNAPAVVALVDWPAREPAPSACPRDVAAHRYGDTLTTSAPGTPL